MNQVYVGDGLWIVMVFDGEEKQGWPNRGNFLGIHFIPLNGGLEWVTVNGDRGNCETEQDAVREIMEAWER